ncbi:MAG: hypothetical protein COA47_16795 [Robiginitomaculum sp.]|nr:MAG: hypothetical protein COA47_16795 [Robiginitomaculum sp.]
MAKPGLGIFVLTRPIVQQLSRIYVPLLSIFARVRKPRYVKLPGEKASMTVSLPSGPRPWFWRFGGDLSGACRACVGVLTWSKCERRSMFWHR